MLTMDNVKKREAIKHPDLAESKVIKRGGALDISLAKEVLSRTVAKFPTPTPEGNFFFTKFRDTLKKEAAGMGHKIELYKSHAPGGLIYEINSRRFSASELGAVAQLYGLDSVRTMGLQPAVKQLETSFTRMRDENKLTYMNLVSAKVSDALATDFDSIPYLLSGDITEEEKRKQAQLGIEYQLDAFRLGKLQESLKMDPMAHISVTERQLQTALQNEDITLTVTKKGYMYSTTYAGSTFDFQDSEMSMYYRKDYFEKNVYRGNITEKAIERTEVAPEIEPSVKQTVTPEQQQQVIEPATKPTIHHRR
jgi:hypothetical protein